MLKQIEAAVREHNDEPGEVTGFLLITFRDGDAMITAGLSDADDIAREIIGSIEAALADPECACDDEQDEIGRCAGHA